VFELCTGDNSVDDIIEFVQTAFRLDEPPADEVQGLVESLRKESLLV